MHLAMVATRLLKIAAGIAVPQVSPRLRRMVQVAVAGAVWASDNDAVIAGRRVGMTRPAPAPLRFLYQIHLSWLESFSNRVKTPSPMVMIAKPAKQ
jgi:hypothetical protein